MNLNDANKAYMVRQRVLELALILAVVVLASCVKRQVVRSQPSRGSCDGACSHYMKCKKTDDAETRQACIEECMAAFTTDGVQDAETLGHIEALDCEATVGLVEGQSGRAPGASERR